jgi:hypothetical protein
MDWTDLHSWGDITAILTFLGAAAAYFNYERGIYRKRKKLENHLRDEKIKALKKGKKGQFSTLRIMKDLGITEDEIIQASFRSALIKRLTTKDSKTFLAKQLLLEYVDAKLPHVAGDVDKVDDSGEPED